MKFITQHFIDQTLQKYPQCLNCDKEWSSVIDKYSNKSGYDTTELFECGNCNSCFGRDLVDTKTYSLFFRRKIGKNSVVWLLDTQTIEVLHDNSNDRPEIFPWRIKFNITEEQLDKYLILK